MNIVSIATDCAGEHILTFYNPYIMILNVYYMVSES